MKKLRSRLDPRAAAPEKKQARPGSRREAHVPSTAGPAGPAGPRGPSRAGMLEPPRAAPPDVVDLSGYLKSHRFFAQFAPHCLDVLAAATGARSVASGRHVFRQGGAALEFYLIRKGQVALEIHAPGRGSLTIQMLWPGDVLGWSWLVEPAIWHADARAIAPTELIVFDAAHILDQCATDARLGYELYRRFTPILVQRLQATHVQLLDLYGHAH